MTAARVSAETVAHAWKRAIELSDSGSRPAKRAAARAHAEALTRRWALGIGRLDSRDVEEGSTPEHVGSQAA